MELLLKCAKVFVFHVKMFFVSHTDWTTNMLFQYFLIILIFRHICKIWKLFVMSVCLEFHLPLCLSTCMKQPGSHWTDNDEILYLIIFWKSVKKIQVKLKSDMNNGYFTWRPMYIMVISHLVLQMRNISNRFVDKIKTYALCSITLFYYFFANCAVKEIIWKNVIQPDRSQMTV